MSRCVGASLGFPGADAPADQCANEPDDGCVFVEEVEDFREIGDGGQGFLQGRRRGHQHCVRRTSGFRGPAGTWWGQNLGEWRIGEVFDLAIGYLRELRVAKKVTYQIIDDLDGAALADGDGETVSFALDGAQFEIDLSDANAEELRARLQPFVGAARKVKSSSAKVKHVATSGVDLSAVRTWARANGHQVADRGRVHGHIVDAYREAHA